MRSVHFKWLQNYYFSLYLHAFSALLEALLELNFDQTRQSVLLAICKDFCINRLWQTFSIKTADLQSAVIKGLRMSLCLDVLLTLLGLTCPDVNVNQLLFIMITLDFNNIQIFAN